MKEFIAVVLIGLGAFIVGINVGIDQTELHYEAEEVIKECEKDLPRSQHCDVKLVPYVVDSKL